jgi:hypothetical protein
MAARTFSGATQVLIAGHPVALTSAQVEDLLGLLIDTDARDAFFAVDDAYVAAGGISYGSGGFRLEQGRAA